MLSGGRAKLGSIFTSSAGGLSGKLPILWALAPRTYRFESGGFLSVRLLGSELNSSYIGTLLSAAKLVGVLLDFSNRPILLGV